LEKKEGRDDEHECEIKMAHVARVSLERARERASSCKENVLLFSKREKKIYPVIRVRIEKIERHSQYTALS